MELVTDGPDEVLLLLVYSLFGMADTETDAVVFFCWLLLCCTMVVVEDVNDEIVVAGGWEPELAQVLDPRYGPLRRSSLKTNFS